jgi:ribosomal protection tetracycline resistance protein
MWRVPRGTLNLGILAHVDAGKTTLTERLLYCAGVIDEPGSVDEGTTQTDSLALERQRGITIKSAVVSFAVGDTTVNLIDTPGHPDFVAEVERALSVLDCAVLVVSAVEGVQPQTRILWRALQRLRVPTLFFVNKIDRRGAGYDRVLTDIAERLTPAIIPMVSVSGVATREATVIPHDAADPAAGSRLAELLAEHDDAVLGAYLDGAYLDDGTYLDDDAGPDDGAVPDDGADLDDGAGLDGACLDDGGAIPRDWLQEKLAGQVKQTLVHPVYFGSAITGAGVEILLHELTGLLPAAAQDASGPVCGRVFKVERGPAGDKIAYVRMFSGTIATRDRVRFSGDRDRDPDRDPDGSGDRDRDRHPGSDREGKVTGISVFADGTAARRDEVSAGQIAKLSGLAEIQIGDTIGGEARSGEARSGADQHHFAPPTLETAIVARDRGDKPRLYAAITEIAEQDPLINVRQDDIRQEIYVSLYGEVQKQVIEATLATEYGIEVGFRETTPICVERPVRTGTAAEILHAPGNPFLATLGIRIDPAPAGTGTAFRLEVGHQAVPLYIYKNMDNFAAAMEQYVTQTLRQGLYGWQVTDYTVSLIRSQYSVPDGPPSTRGPLSSPQDFRKLTPLVVMEALKRAGTVVCEPVHRFRLEAPADTLNILLPVLARLHAAPAVASTRDSWCTLEGDIRAANVHELRQQIPTLTRGEGVMESSFERYQPVHAPVHGPVPTRPRTDENPLNREEYLRRVTRRGVWETDDNVG